MLAKLVVFGIRVSTGICFEILPWFIVHETSIEACDLYLRGRALTDRRSRDNAREAAGIYHQVIAKDAGVITPTLGCT
jgi:hypothetical protein